MFIVRSLLILMALCTCVSPVEAGFWDNLRRVVGKTQTKTPPMIDVLVVKDQPRVLLEVKGRYRIVDPNNNQQITKRYLGKKKVMQSLTSGLKWGEEFPGVFQLQIVPDNLSVVTAIDGVDYRGILFIYDIGGTISIVNRVPIEEFLVSTLPNKYEETLSEETLSAVVIAERTNAFYQSRHPRNRYWAVDGEQVGYRGLQSHAAGSAMERAVLGTRHMLLSQTGAYEGVVTAFPAQWISYDQNRRNAHHHMGLSRISIREVEELAQENQHAAQILSKAFPGSHIEIIY